MKHGSLYWLAYVLLATALGGQHPASSAEPGDATVIFDMDTVRHRPTTAGQQKQPIGSVEVKPGKFDGACLFDFHRSAGSAFFTASVQASPQWDQAAGISFWVKGDGSKTWGGLELIDRSDYALRYGYCFPIDSKKWRKITVPWCDLVAELPAGRPVGPQDGYAPSKFGNLWFGKWYYWRDFPPQSFTVDQVCLEPSIPVDGTDYTPVAAGTPKTLQKLNAKQPVTIVTMGDSLSDKRHWANREVLWSELLVGNLKQRFGGDVTLVNPAIGGTQLTQNLVLMPRWLDEHPQPDLVTVWFGFNDFDSGMRREHFERMLRFAVDRIRRLTKGKSEILLITTCPAVSRWDTMEELAQAVRTVAAEKKTGLADVAAAFHRAGADETERISLYCRDHTHLGRRGHELTANTVADAVTGQPPVVRDKASPEKAGQSRAPSTIPPAAATGRHAVPQRHPRLLGSRERLKQLARQRPEAYQRVVRVAREQDADEHAKMVSLALVAAVEGDEALGKRAVEMAMNTVSGPIKKGHVPFGHDLARCAIVYDLCHEHWTSKQRAAFHEYMNRTVDANVQSETHVFHNGWYGYKNWGIGLACYATFHENPRAVEILRTLQRDYLQRAAPALELAGAGGGWAEGYYIHYWLYEWLFFCEVARWCEGVDYYAAAPRFYRHRAIAGMFESYPGIGIYNSRRPVPIGDGGGRVFGGDRDKALSARRILVNYFRDDPDHQAVHTFNETTPRSSVGVNAYKDFLWRDTTVPKADLSRFRRSHFSPGAGYVYARSSWDEDATYLFFKCGNRFTAHQHLDVGNFLIYRHDELIGDGGHYDGFGTPHDVNYHLRSIAHNTILVYDPAETWPEIRAGHVTGNDGGQSHPWPHHNGAVVDPAAWHKDRALYEIGEILAFEDAGDYVYVAGDATRAYSPKKLACFTRQIVYVRPDTFILFDRVVSRRPEFKKSWLLQAISRPEGTAPSLVITNGKGRLFVQTVLPRDPQLRLAEGRELYAYDGKAYPAGRDTGAAPVCRIMVSPSEPAEADYFLHVLTAKDASSNDSVPKAVARETDSEIRVTVGGAIVAFQKHNVGGYVELSGQRRRLTGNALKAHDRSNDN